MFWSSALFSPPYGVSPSGVISQNAGHQAVFPQQNGYIVTQPANGKWVRSKRVLKAHRMKCIFNFFSSSWGTRFVLARDVTSTTCSWIYASSNFEKREKIAFDLFLEKINETLMPYLDDTCRVAASSAKAVLQPDPPIRGLGRAYTIVGKSTHLYNLSLWTMFSEHLTRVATWAYVHYIRLLPLPLPTESENTEKSFEFIISTKLKSSFKMYNIAPFIVLFITQWGI